MYFTQMYISSGIRVPGSLVARVIEFGASPLYLNHNLSHQPMNLTELLTHYEQCY